MKRINKILISIFVMSILITAVVTSAKDIDTNVPISTNISDENIANPTSDVPVAEIQESKKLTPIEERTRFENRKKHIEKLIKQKGAIMSPSSAINQTPSKTSSTTITSIPTTIPNEIGYTNPITQISIFGKDFDATSIYIDDGDNPVYRDWYDYTFYLPVASYVNMNYNGDIYSFDNYYIYAMSIDDDLLINGDMSAMCNWDYSCDSEISMQRSTYLSKGWHTIYIGGYGSPTAWDDYWYYVHGRYLSVIALPEYTTIIVKSPNGGESWANGTTKTITWTKVGQPGANVKIELYKAGVLNSVISSLTPNDGVYSWYIPAFQPIGTDYKIKITSTSDSKYNDWSNNNFRIY